MRSAGGWLLGCRSNPLSHPIDPSGRPLTKEATIPSLLSFPSFPSYLLRWQRDEKAKGKRLLPPEHTDRENQGAGRYPTIKNKSRLHTALSL